MHFVKFPIATPAGGLRDWYVSLFDVSSIDPDYGGEDRCVIYTRGLSDGRTVRVSAAEALSRVEEAEMHLCEGAFSPLIEALEAFRVELVEAISSANTNPGQGHDD